MYTPKKQFSPSFFFKVFIIAVFAVCVIFPLSQMFTAMKATDLKAVINSKLFGTALFNSVILSLISTAISVLTAFALAFFVTRNDIKLKKLWEFIFMLPMLIPSISHGIGLIILFGGNGIIKNLLNIESTVYGPIGIVLGSVLYSFPVAYIMLADVLKYEDMSAYEAADVLGISAVKQFYKITLPYMRKPLTVTAFSTFSMIITDYGVPLMISGKTKTLSLLMYEEVIGQLNFGKGCVYGIFLLIPAIIAFLVDILNKENRSSSFVKREFSKKKNKGQKLLTYVLCISVSVFVLLPIASFLLLAFTKSYPRDLSFTWSNVITTFNRNGLKYLINSFIIAISVSVIGVVFAYVSAYITSRMKSGLSTLIHLFFLSSMAIPGIVLGLSYAISFADSFIYGTLAIIIMVNIIHFVASPYILMCNSFGKMNDQLENVGATLGISRVKMIFKVFIPQNFASIAEMFSYLFVNCMITISAVSFLTNVGTKPISLLITQFEAQMQYECAAIVSLIILCVNVLVKAIIESAKKHSHRKNERKKACL